jgi:hypothetical protein
VVKHIIANKDHRLETAIGASEMLTCDTYKALEVYNPNFVVANYKQTYQPQKPLAKHHCPEFIDKAVMTNVRKSDKKLDVYLRLKGKKSDVVKLGDWMQKK